MLPIIRLSRVLTSFRMLYPGPMFKILNVWVIDEHGGNDEGLEDDIDIVAQD